MADILGKPNRHARLAGRLRRWRCDLALVGTGVYGNVEDACRNVMKEVERVAPRQQEGQAYAGLHRTFQSLYPSLKPAYGRLYGSYQPVRSSQKWLPTALCMSRFAGILSRS